MEKPPECLHRGDLWQYSAQYGDWLAIKLLLYSHALVVDPDAATGALHRRRCSLNLWMDLCLVKDIVKVHTEAKARRNSYSKSQGVFDKYTLTVETTKVTLQFATATMEQRDEWLHCLLLATKLLATQRQIKNEAAFLRFASSDSEDSEEENRLSSLPTRTEAMVAQSQVKSPTSSVTTLSVSILVKDENDHSIATLIPLSEMSQGRMRIHQLKIDAIRHMKAKLPRLNDNTEQTVTSGLLHLLQRPPHSFILYHESKSQWLQDDDQFLGHYLVDGGFDQILMLELIPVYRMPAPALEINIIETKTKISDLSKRPYTCYVIDVLFNGTTWQVLRRYTEFHTLQTQLMSKYPDYTLPSLPPKHLFTPVKGNFIQARKNQLEAYLKQLILYPVVSTDVVLMSFLGIVSTSRDPELSHNTKRVLHVTSLHESVALGDIVLFSCRFGASRLQRKVTRSKYDHVGIIVPGESRCLLRIMEATSEGVQVYSLKARLMAYAREVSNVIVVRQIETERTIKLMTALTDFVRQVDGNRYSLTELLRFIGKSDRGQVNSVRAATSACKVSNARVSSTGNSSTPSSPNTRLMNSTKSERKYFCSSLVAAAWKELGWIQTRRKSSTFWPGSFEDGGEVERLLPSGVALGPETVIDCRIVEVGLSAVVEQEVSGTD